ncbi:uncharacterized protein HMPREF1541_05831 [Cyphellophora europaea CBS 101466]|uniref:Nuclear speckle splicing regulatory protein 1 N-terminal domain-containing protein n=1 Tax=Cyphellophora europaea (strain CBS 101466) TaxID=1220924 RepID=W2RTG0_CYPE1|nr:uncharacterized protein HMPREF1541_05831 [Cyphellophora europaea CBS 101466]ETN39605.1 hypothetical protein HMPREF1541_05831 [Cyphellophora europaea CBS 101466]
MPALAFGLSATKPSAKPSKPAQKRKAIFSGDSGDESAAPPPPQPGAKKASRPLKPLQPLADDSSDSDQASRPAKSPKLSQQTPNYGLQKPASKSKDASSKPTTSTSAGEDKYTNLSALRSAALHNKQASEVDASVYDYDAVYDTFRPASTSKTKSAGDAAAGPKYMTNLLASTEQRKRDHERAREKAIQRERENEGDEFADKEKFVTSAYKKQQEENRKAEEEEARRVKEEEEGKRKGVGMMGFNKGLLAREEERMKAIQEAEERKRLASGPDGVTEAAEAGNDDHDDLDRKAKALNDHGAKIALNEEGEVIDKRQLLTAGLNVAPKKPGAAQTAQQAKEAASDRPQTARPAGAQNGRAAQRERQSRMIERQMEQMLEQQQAEAEKEQAAQQQKTKSKISEDAKMSAKERYLARKREAEAAKKAAG